MTAQEAIVWIESARYSAKKVGLENTKALLRELGNPEKGVKCVHVAGTNGKGSVCAILESVLRRAGYKTGLYTSPFLMKYNERICINSVPIDDETLLRCALRVKAASDALYEKGVRPSAFELGTAVAFCAFREANVDIAVIEVGLGGRLDPTNVITPVVCAIASIGMDHMGILGDTLEAIAGEKAGILKPEVPAVIYPSPRRATDVIIKTAQRVNAPLAFAADHPFQEIERDSRGSSFSVDLPAFGLINVRVNLAGRHQEENARLAMLTLSCLAHKGFKISREALTRGVADARWPGRLEWINDGLLLDGAHNVDGALALADYLKSYLGDRRIILLTGMMDDKRPDEYAKIIAPLVSRVVATRVNWNRAVPANDMAEIYLNLGVAAMGVEGVENALGYALSQRGERDIVLVAGSLYLVGAVRRILMS